MAQVPVSILGIHSPPPGSFFPPTPLDPGLFREEPKRVALTAVQPGFSPFS